MDNRLQTEELLDFVIKQIEDIKARDIVTLDIQEKSSVTDYMVICSGTSKTHVVSIAENLVVESKRAGLQPLGIEGKTSGEWVLVDLGDIVVHVMQNESRDFYQLEKLWGE